MKSYNLIGITILILLAMPLCFAYETPFIVNATGGYSLTQAAVRFSPAMLE